MAKATKKNIVTGKNTVKASKASKASKTKTGKAKVAKVVNPKGKKVVVTATKKATGEVRKYQHDAIGTVELQYKDKTFGDVYRFSHKLGHRFQLQVMKTETIIFKHLFTARKFRQVDSVKSLQVALKNIKAGKYDKVESTGLARAIANR